MLNLYLRQMMVAGLLFLFDGLFSNIHAQIDVSLATPDFFVIDNQECAMPGPRAGYIGVKICNNTGADLSGLTAEVSLNKLTNHSAEPFTLAGGQLSGQTVGQAGNLEDTGCDVLYWFVGYPCTIDEQVEVSVAVFQNGAVQSTSGGPFTITTEQNISADAGGEVVSQEVGPGIFLGQILYLKVRYKFGNVNNVGDILTMQPAGNQDFNAGCFQLISSEVVATSNNMDDPIEDLFTLGNERKDQISYVITDASQLGDFTGTDNEIEVKYFFRVNCLGQASSALPYANNTSGNQEKYTNNFGDTPLPISGAVNALEISKVVSPGLFSVPFNNPGTPPEEVEYTITLTNTATSNEPGATPADLAVSVDKITDILPGNFSYKALLGTDDATEVTAANSSAVPSAGAVGPIDWVGGKKGMMVPFPYSTYYIEGEGGTLTLTYTANVPEETGAFTNMVMAMIGSDVVGPATAQVNIGTRCPEITAVSGPGMICEDDATSLMATGLADMEILDEQFGIEFVAFPTIETDPAVIYGGGASLGIVPFADLEEGHTKATLDNVSYPGFGTFYIYAIITPPPAETSCRSFAATSVMIAEDPEISISGATTICTGDSVMLTSTTGGGLGNCTIQWQESRDGGATWTDIPGANMETVLVSPATTTDYQALYTCIEGSCQAATSNAITVTVVSDPKIVISGGATICNGGSAILAATTGGGAGACTIQWQQSIDGGASWTDIQNGNSENLPVSPEATTDYRAVYSCIDGACEPDTSNAETVTVLPGPVIDLAFESGETAETICVGAPVNLQYSVSLPETDACNWALTHSNGSVIASGNSSTDVGQTIEVPGVANLPTGTYTFRLSVSCEIGGCAPQDQLITLTVNPVNGIACHTDLHVTLDPETCSRVITPAMVGAGDNCNDYLIQVIVYDKKYGPGGPDNVLDTSGWFNYVLMYDEDEYCWGKIKGEDKTPPAVTSKPLKVHGIFIYEDTYGHTQFTPYGLSGAETPSPDLGKLTACLEEPAEQYFDSLAFLQLGFGEAFEDNYCFVPGSFRFNRLICEDIDQVYQVEASWNDPSYPYFVGFPEVEDGCGNPVQLVSVKDWLDELPCASRTLQETAILKRTFTFKDSNGNEVTTIQEICFYRPQIVMPDCEIYVDLCEFEALGGTDELLLPGNLPALAQGEKGIKPHYYNGRGTRIELDKETCGLSLSYTDREVNTRCGKQLVRTWSFYDWCWSDPAKRSRYIFEEGQPCSGHFEQKDGYATALKDDAGFIQRIIVEALNPMEVVGQDLVVSAGPFNCSAVVKPPAPDVSDCVASSFEFEVWGFVQSETWPEKSYQLIGESSDGYLAGVPVGVYDIYYRVKDDCGRIYEAGPKEVKGVFEPNEEQAFRLEVKDDVKPVAICNSDLHVSLGGTNATEGGLGRLTAIDVDEGSWDNCSPVTLSIRRKVRPECIEQYESLTGRTVNDDGYTAFEEDIYLTCCDVGTKVTIELRVVDEAGNENICWLEIVPENKIKPRCFVTDQTINCLQLDFDPADSAQVAALFGAPLPVDAGGILEVENNCSPMAITEQQSFSAGHCGTGILRRTFTVDNGFSTAACTQTITITEVNDYSVKFPGDLESNICGDNPESGVITGSNACDVLAVSVDTARFDAAGSECFKQLLTYRVINWCEYDGESLEPTRILRDIDGDGDLSECTLLEAGFESDIRSRYPLCETDGVYIPDKAFIVKIFDAAADGTPKRNHPVKILFRADCINSEGDFRNHVGTLILRLREPAGILTKPCYEVYCPTGEKAPASADEYDALIAETCRNLQYDGQCWTPGYYEYTQTVKVFDNKPPLIKVSGDSEFCAFGDPEGADTFPCGAPVRLTFSVTDACTPNSISASNVRLLMDGDAGQAMLPSSGMFTVAETVPGSNAYLIEANALPAGRHAFLLNAADGCGNVSGARIDFVVTDCKTPAPVCLGNLTVDLMPLRDGDQVGMNTIFATDFVASPSRDCTPHLQADVLRTGHSDLRYYVFKDNDLADGPASITIDSMTEDHRSAVFTCDDGEQAIVYVVGLDGAGNFDYCTALVAIEPGNDVDCDEGDDPGIARATISGLITNESLEAVEEVTVQLSGKHSGRQVTVSDGLYTFEELEMGYDYSVTPHFDQNPLEGVSTFDLVLMSKHILGVKPLDSPYKIIAADANKSNSVTTLDLIQLRKLILGLDTGLRNNTSWRFVAADYTFPNPNNPWEGIFPEVISINDLESDLKNADFVAVKVGDVNGSARAYSGQAAGVRSTAGTFHLQTKDRELKAGEEFTVDITSRELAGIQGYQLTLDLDRSAVELVDIQYGLATEEHFGVFADQGMITMSWNVSKGEVGNLSAQAWAGGKSEGLFSLVLQAKNNARLSEALQISSRITRAEAYSTDDELMGIALQFDTPSSAEWKEAMGKGFRLYQNQPNPFLSETVIGFELPAASEVTLTVRDVSGRTLYNLQRSFAAGYQEIVLSRFDLAAGLLYYTLEAGNYRATRKMIVVE